jgi:hypothetical protein
MVSLPALLFSVVNLFTIAVLNCRNQRPAS